MSAPSNRHALRSRIADRLQDFQGNHSQREIGRMLGLAGTTIGARGSDLHSWPAADLLTLALQDEALSNSIVAYLRGDGDKAQGEAVQLHADLIKLLQDGTALDAIVLPNLDRSTSIGRQTIRATMAVLRVHMDKVEADLDAADRVNA